MSIPHPVDIENRPDHQLLAYVYFWACAMAGTSFAGGVFGACFASIDAESFGPTMPADATFWIVLGFISGFIFAGLIGLPVCLSVLAVAGWGWRTEMRHLPAVTGVATGIVAATLTLEGQVVFFGHPAGHVALAGGLGGLFATWASLAFTRMSEFGRQLHRQAQRKKRQFALKSIFVQTTLFAVVIVMWMAIYRMLFEW